MEKLEYKAKSKKELKAILKNELKISERLLRKLKLNKKIFCNGENASLRDEVKEGDIVTVDLSFDEESESIVAEDIRIEVLYEDTSILIVNKPSNMVVHPTCLHQTGTLANAVKFYLESKGEFLKMRFVNRLDRDTSGIVIFAKNEYIQERLSAQMAEGIFKKEYIGIVEGIVDKEAGTIDLPIKREEGSIMTRKVAEDGERAITDFEVIKRLKDMTVIKFILKTGRTHQIRVHSKAIGHPILGDDLYGNKSNLINRQALHAYKVKFIHPIEQKEIEILTRLPEDMKKITECI
jgi:23S rRNA pseudouridine1911/1915/1917 synthase